MGAGGAADHEAEKFAAVAPSVFEADEEIGRLGDEAVEGEVDSAERIGEEMFGGGVEKSLVVDEAGVVDISVLA